MEDSTKNPAHEPLGMSRPLCVPQLAHRHPSVPSVTHIPPPHHTGTHTHTHPWGQLSVPAPDSGESKLWQMASEPSQKASSILGARERSQTRALVLSMGKHKGGCQHMAWCIAGLREGIQAEEVCHRGNRKQGADISTENL